jgi:hypothetical protein
MGSPAVHLVAMVKCMAEQKEYFFERYRFHVNTADADISAYLNTRAAEGWELVSTQWGQSAAYLTFMLFWQRLG